MTRGAQPSAPVVEAPETGEETRAGAVAHRTAEPVPDRRGRVLSWCSTCVDVGAAHLQRYRSTVSASRTCFSRASLGIAALSKVARRMRAPSLAALTLAALFLLACMAYFSGMAHAQSPVTPVSNTGQTFESSTSTDATLSELKLYKATDRENLGLSPTFSSSTTIYTALVINSITQITVEPTTSNSGASIAYLNAADNAIADADSENPGHQVSLTVGLNTIKVQVTAADNVSTQTYTIRVTRDQRTSGGFTGHPGIEGTAQVGRKLTAFRGSIRNEHGQPTWGENEAGEDEYAEKRTYQWIRVSSSGATEISGATSQSYTVATADKGKRLKVRVHFTTDSDDPGLLSPQTAKVIPSRQPCYTHGNTDWCTRLWAPARRLPDASPPGKFYGYEAVGRYGRGQLVDGYIEYRDLENQLIRVRVGEIGIIDYDRPTVYRPHDYVVVGLATTKWLPDRTWFNIGGTRFKASEGKTVVVGYYEWPRPSGLRWLDGQFVTVSASVRYAQLSVSDAEATEGVDESLDFVVTLYPAAEEMVTVSYATSDGTATEPDDYSATSGTLTFAPGETKKTISVLIEDDTVEDDGETLNLTLSNATGALISDASGEGTIRNTEVTESQELTAEFQQVPESHDGTNIIVVRLKFSEDIATSYRVLRDEAISAANGTVRGAERIDGRNDLWRIKAEPSGDEDVTLSIGPSPSDCTAADAVCTSAGTALTGTATATVPGPSDSTETPLTASFSGMPASHTGAEFTFTLTFSEEPGGLSYTTVRDAFDVTGGSVTKAARGTQGSNKSWTITVDPSSEADTVTMTLPLTTDCSASDAICTSDSRPLSNAPTDEVAPAE